MFPKTLPETNKKTSRSRLHYNIWTQIMILEKGSDLIMKIDAACVDQHYLLPTRILVLNLREMWPLRLCTSSDDDFPSLSIYLPFGYSIEPIDPYRQFELYLF